MMLRLFLALLCVGGGLSGCYESPPQSTSTTASPAIPTADASTATIWISSDGTIELDGRMVDIEAVSAVLSDLAERKGVVLYGRDAPEQEPHPNAMRVMEIVVANQLSIRMSTKRDFSDAIGPDGRIKE